ncbi:MAG: class I SAM-dependent methyltransferase [Candidatus Zixiibacteriota bacterium]
MKLSDSVQSILNQTFNENTIWDGAYKIPWDDPDFSRRMLNEHLSQDHDLASRKRATIEMQAKWIHENICKSSPGQLLDLGCGPGLYVEHFTSLGYDCRGIDFSPASIDYAIERYGKKARFIKGDIRSTDFGDGYEITVMLYGELNVFSPDDCRLILKKVCDALNPGGRLLLEVHTYDGVKNIGSAPASWYKSGPGLQGLFSEKPHICLIENHWLESPKVSLQFFHILDEDGGIKTYRSTTKAWTDDDYMQLLSQAEFCKIEIIAEWPSTNSSLQLISAVKK